MSEPDITRSDVRAELGKSERGQRALLLHDMAARQTHRRKGERRHMRRLAQRLAIRALPGTKPEEMRGPDHDR